MLQYSFVEPSYVEKLNGIVNIDNDMAKLFNVTLLIDFVTFQNSNVCTICNSL